MIIKTVLLIAFVFSLTLTVAAQSSRAANGQRQTPPPGRIKLLEGYVHIQEQGIDTQVGRITKENGLNIAYDIGRLAGDYTNSCTRNKSNCLWYKQQTLSDQPVSISLTKDGEITAYFSKSTANFFAKIKSQEDVAEFLLLVLTY